MPSEIPASRPPLSLSGHGKASGSEPTQSLRIVSNLPQQIVAGQQLQAQVVAARAGAQMFNVLLKMQLPNGQQTTVEAQTSQPVNPGQQVNLTAINGQHFGFSLVNSPAPQLLKSLEPSLFPAGSQLQARVAQTERLPSGMFRITLNLDTPEGAKQFSVESAKSLSLNSLITARVNGRFELSLAPPRENFQRLAVQQELSNHFQRQTSPAQALQQAIHLSSQSRFESLSSEGQSALKQLVSVMPQISDRLHAGQIAHLVRNSGVAMERNLQETQQDNRLVRVNLPPAQTADNRNLPADSLLLVRVSQIQPRAEGHYQITLTLPDNRQVRIDNPVPLPLNSLLGARPDGNNGLTLAIPVQQPEHVAAALPTTAQTPVPPPLQSLLNNLPADMRDVLGRVLERLPEAELPRQQALAGSAAVLAGAPVDSVRLPGTLQLQVARIIEMSTPQLQPGQPQTAEGKPLPPGTLLVARVMQLESMVGGGFRASLSVDAGDGNARLISVQLPLALPLNSLVSARLDSPAQLTLALLQGASQATGTHTATASNISGEARQVLQQLLEGLPAGSGKPSKEQTDALLQNVSLLLQPKGAGTGALGQDIKANLLRLIAQLNPQLQQGTPLAGNLQASVISHALPQLLRELGVGNPATSTREQALRFPVVGRVLERLENPNDLGALLRLAAAAISRLQTHQLASLAQTHTTAEGHQLTTWQTEIPMRDRDTVVPVQVRFQEEQRQPDKDTPQPPPIWRLELSFEIEPLGPLHAQVNLQETTLSSKLWAQQENTAQLVNKELHVLRDKLLAAGLVIKELECLQGMPPAPPKALIEQRWIDDLA